MSDNTAAGGRYGVADDEAIELLTEEAQAKNTKKIHQICSEVTL